MEKKIIDYKLLMHDSLIDLEKEVTNFIQRGYQPFGGMCCTHTYAGMSGVLKEYTQAMVKYEFIEQTYTIETEIDIINKK